MSKKIALITGGSAGLGRNGALKLAAQGTDSIITFRTQPDKAHAVVAEIEKMGGKAVALMLDVGISRSFPAFATSVSEALKTHWNRANFDFLVNNAGHGMYVPYTQVTEAQFDELSNVHFKGPYFLTQTLLPLMADGGKILNISSGLARFSLPGSSAYASMKGAVEVMTRYQALELASRRITANVLAPGAIETDFGGGRVRDTPAMNKMIADQTALGRVGLPDDIGDAIAMMLSDANRWMNGQRVEFAGGVHL